MKASRSGYIISLIKHILSLIHIYEGEIISAEEAQNIFKRFYRIDPARSRNGSFGLGLAIAESIVMQHGGKIWVESTKGLNSFYVDLPCL